MKESRRMGWTRHVERMGQKRNAQTVLIGKAKGNKQPGRQKKVQMGE
jgi:hypothetical protein